MIVFVDGEKVSIKEPAPATLKKYGLSLLEWKQVISDQGYRCPICQNVLKKTTNIEHFHAPGWKKMKPEKRKLYVRGVCCWWCNKTYLTKGITIQRAKRLVTYLEEFEKRKP